MPDFLAMATVFTVPSVRDATGNLDGLPTVLLEAMASGRPVVASRIAGIPLVVEPERDGVLTTSGNAPARAAALGRLLDASDLRARLGGNARRRIETELNWDAVAERYETVYLAALEAPCGS
jgi:glycosyltransferase involved in cell wall biosynthesis